jgi:hypothetical protein
MRVPRDLGSWSFYGARAFSAESKNQELLALITADRAYRGPLKKIKDEKTMTIQGLGRSTYPEEKSVLRSGATAICARSNACGERK